MGMMHDGDDGGGTGADGDEVLENAVDNELSNEVLKGGGILKIVLSHVFLFALRVFCEFNCCYYVRLHNLSLVVLDAC